MPLKSEGEAGKAACFQSSLRFFGEGTTLGNRFRKRKRNVLGQGQPDVENHLINTVTWGHRTASLESGEELKVQHPLARTSCQLPETPTA